MNKGQEAFADLLGLGSVLVIMGILIYLFFAVLLGSWGVLQWGDYARVFYLMANILFDLLIFASWIKHKQK